MCPRSCQDFKVYEGIKWFNLAILPWVSMAELGFEHRSFEPQPNVLIYHTVPNLTKRTLPKLLVVTEKEGRKGNKLLFYSNISTSDACLHHRWKKNMSCYSDTSCSQHYNSSLSLYIWNNMLSVSSWGNPPHTVQQKQPPEDSLFSFYPGQISSFLSWQLDYWLF